MREPAAFGGILRNPGILEVREHEMTATGLVCVEAPLTSIGIGIALLRRFDLITDDVAPMSRVLNGSELQQRCI
jgi:hypothetical protein